MLEMHRQLYNAALEQRIAAWRLQKKRLRYNDQARDLTELRAADKQYRALNSQSAQVTLYRLHRAFEAFFRRCKRGEAPGFPRFRSKERYSGWGYKQHGCGFLFTPGDGRVNGRLRLSGIGTIQVRGRARTAGQVKTCDIQLKSGRWYATITIACVPRRTGGIAAVGIDWGIETFAVLAHEDETFSSIPNPRFSLQHRVDLEQAQKNLARKKRRSKNYDKAHCRVAAIQRKCANRRHNFLHQQSSMVVAGAGLVATETLDIRQMTRSAAGTVESPGHRVAQKAGLNREILATAPGTFLAMLRYKAEEAGVEFVEVPARQVKPSQTCSGCGLQEKKPLSERRHQCKCGLSISRDENAARVNLLWGLAHAGREPIAGCLQSSASGTSTKLPSWRVAPWRAVHSGTSSTMKP